MQINKHILSNGLRIVHQEDNSTQMVAVSTLYMVGSRNEDSQHTGFAHLFEHLMFGGSVNIPEYDKPLQLACGDNNAFTDADITNYYITIPSQNIETAFWLESDRMLSLAFSKKSLEVQRNVVMEEFKQNYLNQPYGDLGHLLFDLCYKVHPYRWPTIGLELSHIADAKMTDVKRFFRKFYRPDNAVLSVVGNISWEETLKLADKWYGDIPRGTLDMGKDKIPQEPPIHRQRRRTVRRPVPSPVIVIAFHIPSQTDPDFVVCDLLSDLLANGKSSRMYQRLVLEEGLFVSVDASVIGRMDNGLFIVEGVLPPDADVNQCEEALWEEILRLHSDSVNEHELMKVKNKFEANHNLQYVNYLNRAQSLAHYEALGDACLIEKEVEKYNAVDSQRIKTIARKYLRRSKSAVLRYLTR